MGITLIVLALVKVAFVFGQDSSNKGVLSILHAKDDLSNTDLMLAFVVFRHGDRTPDQEEIDLYPTADLKNKDIFFPFGKKALTNKGKVRGFLVGQYLRQRYDHFISRLYLPNEVTVRTTDYDRTKMTALTAMAGLYPPLAAQKWNPTLNWQPVPYNTLEHKHDDLLYWYNCKRYLQLRNEVYERPEVQKGLVQYQDLFKYLSEHTSTNITTPEDVFYLDNLFQALENVGIKTPKFAQDVMSKIKEMTRIEYAIEFYDSELIRYATGILFADILNKTDAAVAGFEVEPKLYLYSAHENNVAALMAAARAFKPHQPNYGSTFSIELRRNKSTGQYGIAAVYSEDAGGPAKVLPIAGCGPSLCDYENFKRLTKDNVWNREDFNTECKF